MWSRRRALEVVVGVPLALLAARDAPADMTRSGPATAAESPRARQSRPAPHRVPRPEIVGRGVWRADEDLVREPPTETGEPRVVFIHHTEHDNGYARSDVPAMLRAMQEDHVRQGWDDLGYNFVVDRFGTIYEGRGGGPDRPVRGAHTKGFNIDSLGIGALGSYWAGVPVPQPLLDAIVHVAAWKLRPGADPLGRARLVSDNDASRYPKGSSARLRVISGHRDAYITACPGEALTAQLPVIRKEVSRLRKRHARRSATGL